MAALSPRAQLLAHAFDHWGLGGKEAGEVVRIIHLLDRGRELGRRFRSDTPENARNQNQEDQDDGQPRQRIDDPQQHVYRTVGEYVTCVSPEIGEGRPRDWRQQHFFKTDIHLLQHDVGIGGAFGRFSAIDSFLCLRKLRMNLDDLINRQVRAFGQFLQAVAVGQCLSQLPIDVARLLRLVFDRRAARCDFDLAVAVLRQPLQQSPLEYCHFVMRQRDLESGTDCRVHGQRGGGQRALKQFVCEAGIARRREADRNAVMRHRHGEVVRLTEKHIGFAA